MNPSSNGWFKKLLKLAEKENDSIISSKNELYHKLKSVGFIYGSNVSLLFESLKNKDFNQEERCKINYILSLFYINQNIVYANGITLAILHIYNLRYCQCQNDKCCAQ